MADTEAKAGEQADTAQDGAGRGAGAGTGRGGGGGGAGRSAYHHGDLRNALIDAATDLARDGGPEAVVLRAAARRVGVSPTAAYRHFAGQAELLHAVKELGQRRLAESMESAGEPYRSGNSGPGEAEDRVRAIGRGYLAFARGEPGLYRVAFCRDPLRVTASDGLIGHEAEAGSWAFRSFGILMEALDGLVGHGRMSEERRTGAEITAWATVHGLAVLFLDGPLSLLSEQEADVVAERAFDTLLAGFTAP